MHVRVAYLKVVGRLPLPWRRRLESLPLHVFRRQHGRQTRRAWLSGPPYRPTHRRIIIDITSVCNLACTDCNRSCGSSQAPAREYMTPDQIRKFIAESVDQKRRWTAILVEGGEPTAHPQLDQIVHLLDEYKRRHSPWSWIQINTNGYSAVARGLASRVPPGVEVYSSDKRGPLQEHHCAFNVAPVDLPEYAGADFSQGCFQPTQYGLGLNRYGYYPHPACGGIDRVFGFDIGRKTLPTVDDDLGELFPRLCRYCGFFRVFNRAVQPDFYSGPSAAERARRGEQTASWKAAYERYRRARPSLNVY
jgi:hypothetical protein